MYDYLHVLTYWLSACHTYIHLNYTFIVSLVSGHQGRFVASHAMSCLGVIIDYQNKRRLNKYAHVCMYICMHVLMNLFMNFDWYVSVKVQTIVSEMYKTLFSLSGSVPGFLGWYLLGDPTIISTYFWKKVRHGWRRSSLWTPYMQRSWRRETPSTPSWKTTTITGRDTLT